MTLASFEYTLDAAGNRTAVETLDGTESYTYDALNRITSATYPNADVITYTYDAAGNRLTQSLNTVTTATYSYDDAGQMTSDGTTSYSYDDAGNLTDAGGNEFTWDWLGRMTSATVDSTTETYEYDGTGLRVSQTVGTTTTDSLWDRLNSAPLLVDDGSYGYVHADGLLARLDSGDVADYYLTDALGSVRDLTDDTGDVIGTTIYDVFGEVQSHTGASDVFGFTGEQTDDLTGFTYLRARYLDPITGRFVSADSVIPNAKGTQGYNPFVYVVNSPCSLSDPTGHACDNGLLLKIYILMMVTLAMVIRAVYTVGAPPYILLALAFAMIFVTVEFILATFLCAAGLYDFPPQIGSGDSSPAITSVHREATNHPQTALMSSTNRLTAAASAYPELPHLDSWNPR